MAEALGRSQLPALDALRAFAVWLVVLYHHDYPLPGGLGVLAFFVLSGFLITWLLLKEHEKSGGISLKQFYVRRSLRIFPAFYGYWLLVVGALVVGAKNLNVGQAIASFFYVTNYYQAINGHQSSGLSHTWSLGVEEQFYLLWPLALRFALGRQINPVPWLAGVIGVVWVWRAAGEITGLLPDAWVYEAFDTRADQMLVGCLLAIALRWKLAPGLIRSLCAHPALPLVPLGLLAALEALTPIGRPHWFKFTVEPLLVAAIIVQWMHFSLGRAWSWLNWSWLSYLGRISYSTYLYQQLASHLFPVAARLGVPAIVITAPLILAMASFSYWVIETPFLKLKARFGTSAAGGATGTPPPPAQGGTLAA